MTPERRVRERLAPRWRSLTKAVGAWGTVLAAAMAGAAEDAAPLAAHAPYQAVRTDPVTHQIDFRVVVTPPYHCGVLRVWLPLPPSDVAQEITGSEFTTFPLQIEPQIGAEPTFGNRFAYFEFDHPQGAQIIAHRFTAKVRQLDWSVDPARVQSVTDWPTAFDAYRRPPSLTQQAELQALLSELVPMPGNPATDLQTVLGWVDQHLTYDHVQASLQADADHALHHRRGHCSDYHGLCAAMAQSLGYPSRVTYGLNLYPKNSPSHCKLETYLPPYGWVSFDVSETQNLVARIAGDENLTHEGKSALTAAARERLYRGFRENSWLLLTRGVGYDLAPPASRPVRIVRTIYAEADGEPLPEPDPANPSAREFGWMTAHRYSADVPFSKPFADWSTLGIDPSR